MKKATEKEGGRWYNTVLNSALAFNQLHGVLSIEYLQRGMPLYHLLLIHYILEDAIVDKVK